MINRLLLIFSIFIIISCNNIEKDSILIEKSDSESCLIVIPENSDSTLLLAAFDLQKYLYEITGVKLVISTTQDSTKQSIQLGLTLSDSPQKNKILIHDSSRNMDEHFGEDGFMIESLDQTLYLRAATSYGISNAVYGLLEDFLGCKMLTSDYKIIPKNESLKVGPINSVQIPQFTHRELHFKAPLSNPDFCRWHKLNNKRDSRSNWGNLWVHTFDDLIPAERYFESNPEYFSELGGKRIPGGQLCLSNNEMLQVLITNLDSVMNTKPESNFWSVSTNDNFLECKCEECVKMNSKYDGPTGTLIYFVNEVAKKYPKKTISTLAYQYTRSAPKNIKPERNVNIMLCSIECNRSRPIGESQGVGSFAYDLTEWGKLTDNILIWDYVVQFRNLVSPFPNFHVLQPNLQFFEKNNAFMMFQQGCGRNVGEFHELRTYVITKLLWDVNLNVNEIIDEFLVDYYGDASSYIRQYFDIMHNDLIESGAGLNIYGYPYDAINTYLTPDNINQFSELFDNAEKAVSSDSIILERVKNARLPLEYAILEISMRDINSKLTFFTKEDEKFTINPIMRDRLIRFIKQAKKAGVERFTEHGKRPDDYLKAMLNYVDNSMQINLASNKTVDLLTPCSDKYPVGGGAALTNGLIGTLDFHFNWLGFEASNMEAVIDLEEVKDITEIKTTFLQEFKSWIFLPKNVSFYISVDGINYTKTGLDVNTISEKQSDIFTADFKCTVKGEKARYIKIVAESLKKCPDWHIGAGGDCWIFCDEIVVK